jgi:hypothetical protein
MISLTVTGHAEPEQDRAEIAEMLWKYRQNCVVLFRATGDEGATCITTGVVESQQQYGMVYLRGVRPFHDTDDIIRVFPPGTRLRVTVEVVE